MYLWSKNNSIVYMFWSDFFLGKIVHKIHRLEPAVSSAIKPPLRSFSGDLIFSFMTAQLDIILQ